MTRDPAPAAPGRRRRHPLLRRLVALIGGAFVVAVVLPAVQVWREAHPSDRVDVTIPPPPAGEEVFALIADDPTGGAPLAFYNKWNAAIPWSADLTRFMGRGEGLQDTDGDGLIDFAVRWRDAPRLGVLTRNRDGRLLVWWLGPDDRAGPSAFRPLAGGSASIRWPAATEARPPSPALRKRLLITDDDPPAP